MIWYIYVTINIIVGFFLQLANKYEKVSKGRVHEYTEKMHQFMYKRTKQTHKSQLFQTTGSEEAANSV